MPDGRYTLSDPQGCSTRRCGLLPTVPPLLWPFLIFTGAEVNLASWLIGSAL